MKLEQNAQAPLFSNTQIPDIFFSEYLSSANGDYIKIYLYILFLSKYDKDIKLNDLSKKLVLPLKVIQDGIKYWEDAGVLTKKSRPSQNRRLFSIKTRKEENELANENNKIKLLLLWDILTGKISDERFENT